MSTSILSVTGFKLEVENYQVNINEVLNLSEWAGPVEIELSTPILKIENITGGLGLTVVIKNKGNIDALNVILSCEVTGGFIIMLPTMHYEIPLLPAGESTEVCIKIFGIGLGIVTEIPKITISASASATSTEERIIVVKILGPLVKTVGEFSNEKDSFDGYTLFAPDRSPVSYLINNSGEVVYTWNSNYQLARGVYLLESGNLIRASFPGPNPTFWGGGISGRVEELDLNGTVAWEFEYSNNMHCLHHDVEALPNGNILMTGWEYKTGAEAIAAGRDPKLLTAGEMWPDHVIEVEPTGVTGGNIVWEWHIWDHLIQDYDPTKENYGVVEDHPELNDINFGVQLSGDWNHINSIDYNEEFDQIILSAAGPSEIWVIDHSTTTEEAAGSTGGNSGKGGDILYRWGNPQAYRAGGTDDQKLFLQHDAQWIESDHPGEGNILIFNNGLGRPDGAYSSVDEIVPPVDSNGSYFLTPGSSYEPEEPVWSYTAENPSDFFALVISGAQRLPNGNTLICDGPDGVFFEVTPEKEIVWEYVNTFPIPSFNRVFKIRRYAPDYPGIGNLFGNLAPLKPSTPNGPLSGETGTEYPYTTSTTDPDDDQVFYNWDWGDGPNSGWIGPYNSGDESSASHIWSVKGMYDVRVKAKDANDRESEWSYPLHVTMPKSQQTQNTWLLQFLQNHPRMFPILRQLLGL